MSGATDMTMKRAQRTSFPSGIEADWPETSNCAGSVHESLRRRHGTDDETAKNAKQRVNRVSLDEPARLADSCQNDGTSDDGPI